MYVSAECRPRIQSLTMASDHLHFVSSSVSMLFLLILVSTPVAIFSQDPSSSSSSPTIADCMSHLLPLAPCGPFVQGAVQSPAQPCCDNFNQIYTQQPQCLCLLLNNNNNTLISFPLNTTLAMRLPALCNTQQVNVSSCPGLDSPVLGSPPSPSPSTSQVSRAPKNNSTVAASPVVPVVSRPRSASMHPLLGLIHGSHGSNGIRLKVPAGGLALLMAVAVLLITAVLL